MNIHGYPEQEDIFYLHNLKFDQFDQATLETIVGMFTDTHVGKGSIGTDIDFDDSELVTLTLVTGGWSGCEEMIGALQKNKNHWWMAHWKLSQRGGLFEFDNAMTVKRGE